MTRETKVGLLVGMGIILLIGIVVSDHLAEVNQQQPADLDTFAPQVQDGIAAAAPGTVTPADPMAGMGPAGPGVSTAMVQPLPLPSPAPQVAQSQPAPAGGSTLPRIPPFAADPAAPRAVPDAGAPTAAPVPVQMAPQLPPLVPVFNTTDVPLPAPGGPAGNALPSPVVHHVKPGETLYKIAQQYYGNGELWKTLADANRNSVQPGGNVRTGVRLVIPARHGLETHPDFMRVGGGDAILPGAQPNEIRLTGNDEPTTLPVPRVEVVRTIQVASGDTLSGLARKHLGSEGKWKQLLDANRDTLGGDARALKAGMKLRLPGEAPAPSRLVSEPLADAHAAAAPTLSSTASAAGYTVRPGDTLTSIAKRTLGDGSKWRTIFQANRDRLDSEDDLQVGMTLKLPDRG